MDFAEQLRVLETAQGNPAKLALATVDLAYPRLPESGRTALKEALEAAAIPHWCDSSILAALLEILSEESGLRLAQLRKLTVVEPFPARGESALNVHEATRLALRKWLAADRPSRFQMLSLRAASYFAADHAPAGRIEWIYHRLCSAPEEAATELEKLDRAWSGSARPEDRQALTVALRDLRETGLVHGRAFVWVSLCMAWVRVHRGETSQLGNEAHDILKLARELADARAEADAQCLLGDVFETQGRLPEAQSAFGEYLAISRRLAEQDPTNTGWQQELAVAHGRVGHVFQTQGRLTEAQAAFEISLTISHRLAEQDPTNTSWQRELALAHSQMGDVFQAQAKFTEAQAAFSENLAISRRLAQQDPSNAGWQRVLAVAYSRVGDMLRAQGKLTEAQPVFGEFLAISRRLAEQDPSNADWQRELAMAHNRVGDVLQAQGKLTEAQAAFGDYLAISRRLAEHDPSNSTWQRDLAVAYSCVGDVLQVEGKLTEAQAEFEEYLAISRRLAQQDPSNAEWQQNLALALGRMSGVLQAQGKSTEAQEIEAMRQRLADAPAANGAPHRKSDTG